MAKKNITINISPNKIKKSIFNINRKRNKNCLINKNLKNLTYIIIPIEKKITFNINAKKFNNHYKYL